MTDPPEHAAWDGQGLRHAPLFGDDPLFPGKTNEQERSVLRRLEKETGFTPIHDAWWAAACKAHGDRDGTRALIEVLLLGRHMSHEHLVTGLAAALRAGALTTDAVALEARKAAEADEVAEPVPTEPERTNVTFLTERRLAHLPPDTRPLPSVAAYDQLLRPRQPGDSSASQGETP